MVVKIEHAVLASKFIKEGGNDLAASQRNMKGFLYGHDGTVLRRQSRKFHFLAEDAHLVESSQSVS